VSETLEERFFDFSFQVLNYAIEFVRSPGYSSLRFSDVLQKTMSLTLEVEGAGKREFYLSVLKRFEKRESMSDTEAREVFLNELLDMFITEWRKEAAVAESKENRLN
jgi:hypothetical protein